MRRGIIITSVLLLCLVSACGAETVSGQSSTTATTTTASTSDGSTDGTTSSIGPPTTAPGTTSTTAPFVTIAPEPTTTTVRGMIEGPAFVDTFDVLVAESFPVQVTVLVEGNMPTPCHRPGWRISQPAANVIDVTVYSLTERDTVCVQVLDPFEARIPLGSFPPGTYTITVNGVPYRLDV